MEYILIFSLRKAVYPLLSSMELGEKCGNTANQLGIMRYNNFMVTLLVR